jgi:bacillithiol biosynthesis deacetylase BshB1
MLARRVAGKCYHCTMKVDILAFGAHPDDVELAASGTLFAHIEMGKTCAIVDLTQGELGTRGNVETRRNEAFQSAAIMGIAQRDNLGLKDGFFAINDASILAAVGSIRKYQPEIVFCNAITDRHVDHGRAASLIEEAFFLSGLTKIATYNDGALQQAWRPKALYHYIQDRYIKPDLVVDITPYFDKKMASIKAFKSQFYDANSTEPETAISNLDFLPFIESRAREMGRAIGVKYGEGFTINRPIGTKNLLDLL